MDFYTYTALVTTILISSVYCNIIVFYWGYFISMELFDDIGRILLYILLIFRIIEVTVKVSYYFNGDYYKKDISGLNSYSNS